jgi:hypothetical protein
MPLHLRRYVDIWPGQGWPQTHYAVINDEGYTIGVIQFQTHVIEGRQWGWHINGEIVSALVQANGDALDRAAAKAALAKNWRRFLELQGLSEAHRPLYGRLLSIEDRRRLRLPIAGESSS